MNIRSIAPLSLVSWIMATAIALAFASVASAQLNIDGFTQPYKTIKLASDDSGILAQLHVEEGSEIKKGSTIARLDERLQKIQLRLAEHQASASSNLDAAKQLMEKREQIYSEIEQLRAEGHASESEVIRADMERSIARAKFLAAQEESISRQIDLERAKIQLERRSIKAPFTGTVAEIHRQEGEFISPVTPEVVTLIQTDTLLAAFNIPSSRVSDFSLGQSVPVVFASGFSIHGQVHSIAVQTKAESSTVEIKIRLDNSDQGIRSGEQCVIKLDSE